MKVVIIFNKYISIPKKDLIDFEHNYIDDILIIRLKNNQTIKVKNFTFDDFNKITYKEYKI